MIRIEFFGGPHDGQRTFAIDDEIGKEICAFPPFGHRDGCRVAEGLAPPQIPAIHTYRVASRPNTRGLYVARWTGVTEFRIT